MRTLYLECGMGAAGDMLMAALLELLPDRQGFIDRMNALGIPGVTVAAQKAETCGITGTHIQVTVYGEEEESHDVHYHEHHGKSEAHGHTDEHSHHRGDDPKVSDHMHHVCEESEGQAHAASEHEHDHHHGHHHHAGMQDIHAVIHALDVSEKVRTDACAVYDIIAQAESQVHGVPVDQIHFHEVGTMDAVADVVGVCLLMEMIGADQVIASPVHVGAGYVHCMHGILPVPAPATALILKDIPTYGGEIQGELCTPTGAALLRYFADSFGIRPVMSVESIGYGMGSKKFERANCVRAFLGQSESGCEKIVKLECNLDDMTPEDIGYAMECLFASGARDVYTVPCGMKKNRPGVILTCICMPWDADAVASAMMKHTTTLGIRRLNCDRYAVSRSVEERNTEYGSIRVKHADGMGIHREKIEHDDLVRIAKAEGLSLYEIREALNRSC